MVRAMAPSSSGPSEPAGWGEIKLPLVFQLPAMGWTEHPMGTFNNNALCFLGEGCTVASRLNESLVGN